MDRQALGLRMLPYQHIVADTSLPDGSIVGHDAQDNIVVAMETIPHVKYVTGEAADRPRVLTWHVSPRQAHRFVWESKGFYTAGNA